MRILDVGCGTGRPPRKTNAGEQDSVIGIDSNLSSLAVAKRRFPGRHFVCCQAEALPFADSSFGRVVSSVAIPYTDIPVALAEIRRVLVPEGSLFMSVHHLRFTLGELRAAFPNPIAILYRLYVLANGLIFHASGRLVRFPNGKVESFQTTRALERALGGAGFVGVEVSRPTLRQADVPLFPAPVENGLFVTATNATKIRRAPRSGISNLPGLR